MAYSIKDKSGTIVQSLVDFLRKPVEMYHLTSFPAVDTIDQQISLPSEYFGLSTGTMVPSALKVQGFLGFRATTVITMVLNATKFTQGRLMMLWNPNSILRGDGEIRFRNRLSQTQLPHVEMDVACDTSVVLRIPYYSVTPYYQLIPDGVEINRNSDFGQMALATYSPIAVGASAAGGSTAELSVFVHFEDVELVTPSFTAQSGSRIMTKKSDSEIEASTSISSSLSMVSKAMTVMSGIPMLSSFLRPAAWVTAALSDSVARFGFSKPTGDGPVSAMVRYQTKYMNNYNGSDGAIQMSNSACNSVAAPPSKVGSDIDEMSLAYIAQIPCWTYTINWSNAAPSGTNLLTWIIGSVSTGATVRTPFKLVGDTFDSTFTTWDFTPLGLLLENFLYYRGSIVVRMKIVKTTFHSGRLMVAFNPGVTGISLGSTAYLMREYVDIREGSVFEFTLPYAVLAPYIRLGSTYNTTVSDCFGTFKIWVENPLTAPDTCSGNVDIILESFAGPDCKFAAPSDPRFAPACSNVTRSVNDNRLYFTAQSNNADPCNGTPIAGSFGGVTPKTNSDVVLDSEIFGEEFVSLKQLLLISRRFNRVLATTNYGVVFRNADGLYASLSNSNLAAFNPLCVFTACFGYATGGYRYHFQGTDYGHDFAPIISTAFAQQAPVLPGDGSLFGVTTADLGYFSWNNQIALSTASDNTVSVTIPCYNQLPMRLIRPNTSIIDPCTSPLIVSLITKKTIANGYINVWKSFRDDTRLGYWLGTPPITTARLG